MTLDKRETTLTLTLTEKEVLTWMAALRQAARTSTVPVIPWDYCCFLQQHLALVKLTGYESSSHEQLHAFLEKKDRDRK